MKDYDQLTLQTDFVCLHCHNFVSAGFVIAGVNNRNHCPYCLWSRHLDWRVAGDRLSACKAGMRPIGLTVKKTRKKYGRSAHGELMLVHRCTDCGKIAINRIAADDDSQTAMKIFEDSLHLDTQVRQTLDQSGIQVLRQNDQTVIEVQLFGWRERVFARSHYPWLGLQTRAFDPDR
jgi:DNA-directed RNA polymerase subunit RPC12/RpoP